MRTRFVVALGGASTQQQSKLTVRLRKTNVNWWHWMESMWLIVDPEGRAASYWRDKVKEWVPKCDVLVLEVRGGGWAAVDSKRYDRSPFKWLRHVDWVGRGDDEDEGEGEEDEE